MFPISNHMFRCFNKNNKKCKTEVKYVGLAMHTLPPPSKKVQWFIAQKTFKVSNLEPESSQCVNKNKKLGI